MTQDIIKVQNAGYSGQKIYHSARQLGKTYLAAKMLRTFDGVGFLRPLAYHVRITNSALRG